MSRVHFSAARQASSRSTPNQVEHSEIMTSSSTSSSRRNPIARRYGPFLRMLIAMLIALSCSALVAAESVSSGADRIFRSGFEQGVSLLDADLQPPDLARLPADALPEIALRLTGGDADAQDWRLLLDGNDLTAQSQASSNGIVFVAAGALIEGNHSVRVELGTDSRTWTFRTETAPVIDPVAPQGDQSADVVRPVVEAQFSDVGAGVDPTDVTMILDGADVTALASVDSDSVRFEPGADLDDGMHEVTVDVTDRAGNQTTRSWSFQTGAIPEVEILAPLADLHPFGEVPALHAVVSLSRGEVDPQSLRVFLNDIDLSASATLVAEPDGSYSVRCPLDDARSAGQYTIYLELASGSGRSAWAERVFEMAPEQRHELTLVSPALGSELLQPMVRVVVASDSTAGAPRSMTIGGIQASAEGWADGAYRFGAVLTLVDGQNPVEVRAHYADGVTRSMDFVLMHDAPASLRITSPQDWSAFGPLVREGQVMPGAATDLTGNVQRPVPVVGELSKPVASVQINQQQAQLSADGRSFEFPAFFLHEGTNLLSVVATDARGRSSTAQLTLYVDQTAPLVTVESPESDAATSARLIDVRGFVNDAVEARVGAPQPIVEVTNEANGQRVVAEVFNLGYEARDIPLEVGINRLSVTARDQFGNTRSRQLEVARTAVGATRLKETARKDCPVSRCRCR